MCHALWVYQLLMQNNDERSKKDLEVVQTSLFFGTATKSAALLHAWHGLLPQGQLRSCYIKWWCHQRAFPISSRLLYLWSDLTKNWTTKCEQAFGMLKRTLWVANTDFSKLTVPHAWSQTLYLPLPATRGGKGLEHSNIANGSELPWRKLDRTPWISSKMARAKMIFVRAKVTTLIWGLTSLMNSIWSSQMTVRCSQSSILEVSCW